MCGAALVLLTYPLASQAQYTQEAMKVCAGTARVAENIMTRRMAGERKEDLLRDMQSQGSPGNRERGIYMVEAAYAVPPLEGDARRIVIQGFRDSFYVHCLNEVSGFQ